MIVPFAKTPSAQAAAPAQPPPSEAAMLMALAEMHKQGRFQTAGDGPSKIYDVPIKSNDPFKMEDEVDQFIKDKGVQEGDIMRAQDRSYKYLGPNSGGRKDWIEVPKTKETS